MGNGTRSVCMFDTAPFEDLWQQCELAVLDQCMYGAATVKPTMLLYYRCAANTLEMKCDHQRGEHERAIKHPESSGKFFHCKTGGISG